MDVGAAARKEDAVDLAKELLQHIWGIVVTKPQRMIGRRRRTYSWNREEVQNGNNPGASTLKELDVARRNVRLAELGQRRRAGLSQNTYQCHRCQCKIVNGGSRRARAPHPSRGTPPQTERRNRVYIIDRTILNKKQL